jgi:23S rRNA pseudouridine1911/1915/1917 synthase
MSDTAISSLIAAPSSLCSARFMPEINHFAFSVHSTLHGIRIDSFLVRQLRNYTPFRMQRIVRCGAATVDGEVAPLSRRVRRGERVTVRLVEPPDKLFDPEPLPLDVLFEDDSLIAVNKPAGLITHPVGRRQTGTLCNAIQHHLDRQTGLRGILRPGIVHRLDRMTSGVLVVAKDFLAHKRLSIQFQRNQVRKEYLAIVEGTPEPDMGEIDRPIGLLAGGNSILMTAHPDARDPKPARTWFEVVRRFDRTTLLRAVPLTGRIHQIRVHLAAIGHPVVGDEFYGPFGEIRAARFDRPRDGDVADAASFGPEAGSFRHEEGPETEPRHLLHAATISFEHPGTRTTVTVTAPLPECFRG